MLGNFLEKSLKKKQWHRGLRQGRGTLTQMSGSKYTGNFDKGEKHGHGEYVDVDGVR